MLSLFTVDFRERMVEKKSPWLWLEDISSSKAFIFTKDLSDVIFCHLLPEIIPESIMETQRRWKLKAPESQADM